MSNLSVEQGTKIVGYFNGKAWPIHLVISELNVTLQLKPGDFIIDRQGNKINDPFFEKYSGQLSKEVSNTLVPVRLIPRPNAVAAPARDGMAVREVTKFTVDKHGHKTPVIPPPMKPAKIQAENFNPVRGMSVEEARKLKLIKPTRPVPEDYGATESDGMPTHGGVIPEIKYATDTVRSKAAPLPKELTTLTTDEAAKLPSAQVALAQNLAETSRSVPATTGADEPGFGNPAVDASLPAQISSAPAAPPAAVAPPVAVTPPETSPPETSAPPETEAGELPAPVLDDLPEPPTDEEPEELPAGVSSVEGSVQAAPATVAESAPAASVTPKKPAAPKAVPPLKSRLQH